MQSNNDFTVRDTWAARCGILVGVVIHDKLA
ncbi:hypothetical protein SAMN05660900_01589 [Megasphaera cerevisiae DSM 20462]|nr:hypothetical protein SAMN05660900_01589 [Megasphaera cerevisiae DSM 20462]